MRPTTRRLLLGSAALLLAALGAFGFLWRSSIETTAPSASELPLDLQWRVGSSQQYTVAVDSSVRMNSAGSDATQSMRVQLQGVLDMHTLEAGPPQALVGMRLSAVELQIAGKSDPGTHRALASPFRVRFASGGLPTAFEFPAGMTAQHREMLENLVRMFQVSMHKGPTWVAQESNASGAYEAAYVRTTPSRVEKTKRRIVGPAPATVVAVADIASKESIRIDAKRDWVAAMTVDETLKTTGQFGPAIDATSHATLELRPESSARAAVDPDIWRFAAAAAPQRTHAATAPIASPATEDAQGQLLAELPALDATREGRSVRIHRLRDLLRVDGKLPFVLLDAMRTQELNDRTRADLYLALELAGSTAAQAALVSVVSDTTWSTRDAMRAIVALGGVKRPDADTLAALWNTVHNGPASGDRGPLADTATFALGSLGSALNAVNDPNYGSLRSGLLNGALSGNDPKQRANFVHAIGNTRDASLARQVVALLDDSSPSVRSAAAQSLGMLGTNQVGDDLMRRLGQEPNSVVRGAIAESLVSWSAPPAPAVASIRTAIGTEPDENTRYNMARLLGKSLASFPENRAVLQDLLRVEQSKRIRQQVAQALVAAQ